MDKVSCNINEVIQYLINKRDEGYKMEELIIHVA